MSRKSNFKRKMRRAKRQRQKNAKPPMTPVQIAEGYSEEIKSWLVRWDFEHGHSYLRIEDNGSRVWVDQIWYATQFETESEADEVAAVTEVEEGEVSVSGLGSLECSPGFEKMLRQIQFPPAS